MCGEDNCPHNQQVLDFAQIDNIEKYPFLEVRGAVFRDAGRESYVNHRWKLDGQQRFHTDKCLGYASPGPKPHHCQHCAQQKESLDQAQRRYEKAKQEAQEQGKPEPEKPESLMTTEDLQKKAAKLAQELRNLKQQSKKQQEQIKDLKERLRVYVDAGKSFELYKLLFRLLEDEELKKRVGTWTDVGHQHHFLYLLLTDQLKRMSVENAVGMRWHPRVIQWALSVLHSGKTAGYLAMKEDLDKDGLFAPSLRLLRDYKHVGNKQPGWQEDDIKNLNTLLNFHDAKKVIFLAFDEIAIMEGLVFDVKTGALLGYVSEDLLGEQSRLSQVHGPPIASKVLQFFAITAETDALGRPKLTYPLAWYATDNLTAKQIDKAFNDGVEALWTGNTKHIQLRQQYSNKRARAERERNHTAAYRNYAEESDDSDSEFDYDDGNDDELFTEEMQDDVEGDPSFDGVEDTVDRKRRAHSNLTATSPKIRVVAAICDGLEANRKFIKLQFPHHTDTKNFKFSRVNTFDEDGSDEYIARNKVTGEKLFFIIDPPHLIKRLRNAFYHSFNDSTGEKQRFMVHRSKKISWQLIKLVYQKDTFEPGLRKTHLTKDSVYHLHNRGKMNTRRAMEIFQFNVVEVMVSLGQDLGIDVEATVWFLHLGIRIKRVLFSSFITEFERRERDKILKELTEWHDEVFTQEKQNGSRRTKESNFFIQGDLFEDLIITLNGITNLSDYLLEEYDIKVNPSAVNQNPVEAWFSKHRAYQGMDHKMDLTQYAANQESLKAHQHMAKGSDKTSNGDGLSVAMVLVDPFGKTHLKRRQRSDPRQRQRMLSPTLQYDIDELFTVKNLENYKQLALADVQASTELYEKLLSANQVGDKGRIRHVVGWVVRNCLNSLLKRVKQASSRLSFHTGRSSSAMLQKLRKDKQAALEMYRFGVKKLAALPKQYELLQKINEYSSSEDECDEDEDELQQILARRGERPSPLCDGREGLIQFGEQLFIKLYKTTLNPDRSGLKHGSELGIRSICMLADKKVQNLYLHYLGKEIGFFTFDEGGDDPDGIDLHQIVYEMFSKKLITQFLFDFMQKQRLNPHRTQSFSDRSSMLTEDREEYQELVQGDKPGLKDMAFSIKNFYDAIKAQKAASKRRKPAKQASTQQQGAAASSSSPQEQQEDEEEADVYREEDDCDDMTHLTPEQLRCLRKNMDADSGAGVGFAEGYFDMTDEEYLDLLYDDLDGYIQQDSARKESVPSPAAASTPATGASQAQSRSSPSSTQTTSSRSTAQTPVAARVQPVAAAAGASSAASKKSSSSGASAATSSSTQRRKSTSDASKKRTRASAGLPDDARSVQPTPVQLPSAASMFMVFGPTQSDPEFSNDTRFRFQLDMGGADDQLARFAVGAAAPTAKSDKRRKTI